ncbi:hypothetical protein PAMA_021319 [Pampus argenteus]
MSCGNPPDLFSPAPPTLIRGLARNKNKNLRLSASVNLNAAFLNTALQDASATDDDDDAYDRTSMAINSPCNEPNCKPCGEKEYREGYTTENKCERQPYCDPNSNFEVAKHTSKTKKTICMCKAGYHFSSEARITCVLNTKCEPGKGVRSKGNQTHDTVCQNCPEGTFSDEASWDGACKKWTE